MGDAIALGLCVIHVVTLLGLPRLLLLGLQPLDGLSLGRLGLVDVTLLRGLGVVVGVLDGVRRHEGGDEVGGVDAVALQRLDHVLL